MRKYLATAIAVLFGAMAIAACGGSSHKVVTSASDTKAANQASSLITNCVEKVSAFKLITKSGRKQVVTCLEAKVPPAKRAAFEKCLTDAAISDKIWSKSGRLKFEQVSAPNCSTKAGV